MAHVINWRKASQRKARESRAHRCDIWHVIARGELLIVAERADGMRLMLRLDATEIAGLKKTLAQ